MAKHYFIEADIDSEVEHTQLKSFKAVYHINKSNNIKKWLWGIVIALIITLFLPWTQNIRATGAVTTLRQEQRPQGLNTII
ncbi:hypothetical protein, partial [Proteus mirabilis]|uniref:hypothetical protein n=1 Tax=Proteus mirabilis TaxID=584 RepID=UPI001954197C